MTQECIVCGGTDHEKIVLNRLPLLRCRGCGLIRRREFDISISYYEEIDPSDTPEKRRARLRNSKDRIRQLSPFVPLSGWCDVGTGEGIFLEALAARGGTGIGIEPGDLGKKKAAEHGVRIAGETIEDIARVASQEDVRVVSLFHVIEHLERPDIEIRRIHDALPPSGFLVLETPDIDSPVFKLRGYEDPLIYPEHLWYFSEKTLRVLLEKRGFRVIATGRRDFDQQNIPIRESLFRLGLSSRGPVYGKRTDVRPERERQMPRESASRGSGARTFLRRVLSRLVAVTGRLQYLWVVAQKAPPGP